MLIILAPPPLPEHFEEDLWQMLFQSIQAVKTGQELPFHLEELYRVSADKIARIQDSAFV